MFNRIYQVDNDSNTQVMANELALPQAQNQNPLPIHDFVPGVKNPILTLRGANQWGDPQGELMNMLFVGQTKERMGEMRFGGFTPAAFAEHFVAAFNPNPFSPTDPVLGIAQRLKVINIYLLGAQAGLSNPQQNDSFAQSLANELYKRGFNQVIVRAVAYEKKDINESMYVDVMSQCMHPMPGTQAQLGMIVTQSIGNQKATQIKQMWEEKLTDQERDEIRKLRLMARIDGGLLHENLPLVELFNRPENEFHPNEKYKQRQERIQKNIAYQARLEFREDQIKVMGLLRNIAIEYVLCSMKEKTEVKDHDFANLLNDNMRVEIINDVSGKTEDQLQRISDFLGHLVSRLSMMDMGYQKICKFLRIKYEKEIAQNDFISKFLGKLCEQGIRPKPEPVATPAVLVTSTENPGQPDEKKEQPGEDKAAPLLDKEKQDAIDQFLADARAKAKAKPDVPAAPSLPSVSKAGPRRAPVAVDLVARPRLPNPDLGAPAHAHQPRPPVAVAAVAAPALVRRPAPQVAVAAAAAPAAPPGGGGGGGDIPVHIRRQINFLIGTLEAEIAALRNRRRRTCFKLFNIKESGSKQHKLASLQGLSRHNFMRDLVPHARHLLRDAGTTHAFYNTATRRVGVSRVKNLLKEIVGLQPQPPKNAKKVNAFAMFKKAPGAARRKTAHPLEKLVRLAMLCKPRR